MLQKFKKKLKNWVSTYSNKESSVRLGAPTEKLHQKINRYIKHKIYIFKLGSVGFSDKYDLKHKFFMILGWAINILVTGFAIKYCLDNQNALSYGLTTILIMFYFERVVLIIKEPIKKDDEEK